MPLTYNVGPAGSADEGIDYKQDHHNFARLDSRGLSFKNPPRFAMLRENWAQKPGVKGDSELTANFSSTPTAAQLLAARIANLNFMVVGTNAVSADVAFTQGAAGITAFSHGADGDSTIIAPSLTTNQSAWAQPSWRTDNQTRFEPIIRTGRPLTITTAARSTTTASITTSIAHGLSVGQSVTVALATGPTGYAALSGTFLVTALTSTTVFTYTTVSSGTVSSGAATGSVSINTLLFQTIWTGLKLTNTATIATDADQFYARYLATENNGQWQIVTSRNSVAVTTVLPEIVKPNTPYRFRFNIGAGGIPNVELNGVPYNLQAGLDGQTGASGNAALRTGISLIPYSGVSANGSATAKSIDIMPDYAIGAAA